MLLKNCILKLKQGVTLSKKERECVVEFIEQKMKEPVKIKVAHVSVRELSEEDDELAEAAAEEWIQTQPKPANAQQIQALIAQWAKKFAAEVRKRGGKAHIYYKEQQIDPDKLDWRKENL